MVTTFLQTLHVTEDGRMVPGITLLQFSEKLLDR